MAIAALAYAASMSFTACDNIDDDERYLPVERPNIERVVLVEEFTGQSCVNCPNGAATIHALQTNYPGSVIAVCFHPQGTPFTAPLYGIDLGLTSEQATDYFNYYKPNGFPAAIINGGELLYNIDQWSTAVSSALSTESPADINLDCEYDADTRKLTANWNVVFNHMYSSPCSLLLWVMENGIVGPQTSTTGPMFDYTHNHVFRQSMNGLWGESIGDNFATEQSLNGSSSITLPESWKAENIQVVAFIFQTSSKRVEQATLWPAEE